ncbi:T9SS type B sorting domain-containing protein [Flavobacterium hauense]
MKQAQILLSVIMLMFLNVNAQQENNWYFGRMAGLNFSSGRPVAITSSTMSTMEGSASISDTNGNILFYTDGISVWNRLNRKMPHGTGLLGDQSTTQSAVIVPKPGSNTHYYIFTADDAGGPNGLTYSEVDMNADNGKGDVISLNIALITPVTEKITAVYHANGSDIWITTHQWGGDAFYSFRVSSAGVNSTPVVSNTGLVIEGTLNSGHYAGWMNISPDGKKLASASGLFAIELFDFDNQTGKVSNATVLKTPAKCYGVEFSPDSKILYSTSDGAVLQYQLNSANIAASQTSIGAVDVASSIKLGPDSKIYVVSKYLSTSLSVINNPNAIGKDCNFVQNAVDLGGKETFVGLPNFLISPYYVIDIDAKNDCDDTAVSFEAIGTLENEDVIWDFGDGNQSTNAVTTHRYAQSGTYTVNLKSRRHTTVRYFSKQITVLKAPVAGTPDAMYTCGTNGTGTFDLAAQNAAILGSQPAGGYTVSYYATLLNAQEKNNPLPLSYTNSSNPQTVYARISRNSGVCYDTTSFTLNVAPSPVLEMEDNYSLCEGSYTVLSAPKGFDSYKWTFDGKTVKETSQMSVSKPGTYTLTVTKTTGTITCDATKTILVTESQKPKIKTIEVDDWSDYNNSIDVVMASLGEYEYSIDGVSYQGSPRFSNLEPGIYTVTVKNDCGQAEDEIVLLMYPKFFTPNGDGIHDKWQVKHAFFANDVSVTIFDRYGKIITAFKGNSSGWDGTFNGNNLPANDYWFVINRSNGKEYKGHFSLIR